MTKDTAPRRYPGMAEDTVRMSARPRRGVGLALASGLIVAALAGGVVLGAVVSNSVQHAGACE